MKAERIVKEGRYGVVEFNNFSAQRNGRTKAQLPLNGEDFANRANPCEQGMLLAYDEATGSVRKPTSVSDNVMLHKSEEKLYFEYEQELSHFALFGDMENAVGIPTGEGLEEGEEITELPEPDAGDYAEFAFANNPRPRLYQLDIGDTWTTNTVVLPEGQEYDELAEAFAGGQALWGVPFVGTTEADKPYTGYVEVTADAAEAAKAKAPLRVIAFNTMPNGTKGIKLEVQSPHVVETTSAADKAKAPVVKPGTTNVDKKND